MTPLLLLLAAFLGVPIAAFFPLSLQEEMAKANASPTIANSNFLMTFIDDICNCLPETIFVNSKIASYSPSTF